MGTSLTKLYADPATLQRSLQIFLSRQFLLEIALLLEGSKGEPDVMGRPRATLDSAQETWSTLLKGVDCYRETRNGHACPTVALYGAALPEPTFCRGCSVTVQGSDQT